MKKNTKSILFTIIFVASIGKISATIIPIPKDYNSVQEGINAAATGDTILISPGTYNENILLTKELTIASEFIISGKESAISETIIDGQTNAVFTVTQPKNGISNIIGLTIRNGDDGLMVSAPINLLNNIITGCDDGIDYETGGGGLCKNNIFRNNFDDGVDLDGTLLHIIVENNIIADNEDDGIEIRLHSYKGNPSYCRISNNEIYGNDEDGIQFIDYPDTTLRIYLVERNLIYNNSMAGIAFMDNGDTKEDYRGAQIPEPIYVFNNTISGNNYGMTGGGGLVALNNTIINSGTTGILNADGNSIVANNLFFANTTDTVNSKVDLETNMFTDPKLSDNFVPEINSPCIDKGIKFYVSGKDTLLNLTEKDYLGEAPEIGAIEFDDSESFINDFIHKTDIRVFPNPFHDYFNVEVAEIDSESRLQLFSSEGKIITSQIVVNPVTNFYFEELSGGVYFINYYFNEGWQTGKIIKF